MEGCGMKCIKYTMFIFNFLFFLGGGAILGLGIWAAVDAANFMTLVSNNPAIFNAVYVIIAVGAALLIISFLGCCGAIQENKCLLGTFFAIVLIIFIIEIVGGILVFVFYPNVTKEIVKSIDQYNHNSTEAKAITDAWDAVQSVFRCCGFNSPMDWKNTSNWIREPADAKFPKSCCERTTNEINGTIVNEKACLAATGNYYTVGCEQKFKTAYWIVGGVCLGVLAIELLALIFTCCLFRAVDKD